RLSRVSNDLNSYEGVSVTTDRRTLTTGRRETRIGMWIGDASAGQLQEAIPAAPFGGAFLTGATVAWAGDRFLYGAMSAETPGSVGVASIVPGHGGPKEVVPHARFASATSDGQTIVFQRNGLWRVDGDGGHPVQLTTDGFVPLVTPDDRHVIVLSNRS